ncbi:hypothetical protein A0K93_01300 [Corynebacterium sp. BCW_4722]|nr:hypothetical protein A0K93_01300 [Corynebacterium sp. BCW_4722]
MATTGVWADVASAVTGNEVEAIISDRSIDPHHFEPSAKDLARVRGAETVVANGGHYDASLYTVAEQDRIIHAVPLLIDGTAHDHDHDHDHEGQAHDHAHSGTPESLDELEHIWFSPEKVKEVAQQIQDRVGGDATKVTERLDAIESRLKSLKHAHLAMTEPIAAPLVWGTELHDITPEGYMHAALNHSEPSVSDIAQMMGLIESGTLDLLVVNPQSTNGATERLAKAAQDNDVPVVEIRETPPEGVDFLDYFEQIIDEIEATVQKADPLPDTELPQPKN